MPISSCTVDLTETLIIGHQELVFTTLVYDAARAFDRVESETAPIPGIHRGLSMAVGRKSWRAAAVQHGCWDAAFNDRHQSGSPCLTTLPRLGVVLSCVYSRRGSTMNRGALLLCRCWKKSGRSRLHL